MKNNPYTEYLAEKLGENLDENIKYAEYLAENLDKNIKYVEYLAEKLGKPIDNKIINRKNKLHKIIKRINGK